MCCIVYACQAAPFNGWTWIDLDPDQRVEYLRLTIQAAKELPNQYAVGPEIEKIYSVIVRGTRGKDLQEIIEYINAYYKTRKDLYTPIVAVLHKYAKENISEVI